MLQKTSLLLTKRELEVIDRKLNNKKLTQQDSNYLSKFVRPKLKEMATINPLELLDRLEYNQKIHAVENKIKILILNNIKHVSAIVVYGSAVYTNYKDYKDIDVLVVVKKKFWKKTGELFRFIKEVEKKTALNVDIKIHSEEYVSKDYSSNITLIYQLESSKVIYGILNHPNKVSIPKLYLQMQCDYGELFLKNIADTSLKEVSARELYSAIRNLWIIRLIMDKKADNLLLNSILNEELGINIITKLRSNNASFRIKEIAHLYLEELYMKTIMHIKEVKGNIEWEEKVR